MVTNWRILKVEGILNKRAADSSLEKINDAVLDQNVVGRMLNYGDLDILTAADSAIDRYRMLNKAPTFKREMLQQKYALETEFAYHAPPTPPLRPEPQQPQRPVPPPAPEPAPAAEPPWQQPPTPAPVAGPSPVAAPAAPAAPASSSDPASSTSWTDAAPSAAAAEAAAGSPAPTEDESTAVTQTLARLADLRDRGAITPEEYETKKDELLGRL